MVLSNVREFFWPLLDMKPIKTVEIIALNDLQFDESNTEEVYYWAKRYFETEEERRRTIESKSTIFIGTFGVVTAIITVVAKDIITSTIDKTLTFWSIFSTLVLICAIIYYCRAIWFTIKTLERMKYNIMGFNDFNISGNKELYVQSMILQLINMTKKNSLLTNEKINNLVLAQEYFKRAIVAIAFFPIVVFINVIFVKTNFNILDVLYDNNSAVVFMLLYTIFTILLAVFSEIYQNHHIDG